MRSFKELKVAQPDGTLVAPSHPIKIREILSHTSGLRFLNSAEQKVIDRVPLKESIEHDLLEPLLFDPGSKYLYSNEGIDAAGRIIEIITNTPFDKFLQDRLFTPLGMLDTTFFPSNSQVQRLAKSYRTNAENGALEETKIPYLTYPLDGPSRLAAPGGGLFSTAKDVARFAQMLANGGTFEGKTYLSKSSHQQMTTKQTGDKLADKYGFGLTASDGSVFGHGGAFQTMMNVDRGLVQVFLVQHTGKWAKGNPAGEFLAAVRSLHLSGSSPAASSPSVPEGTQAR